MKFYGDRLREIRKKRGFSQEELADAIGAAHASISKWENGVTIPLLSSIEKLTVVLDCTAQFLTGDTYSEENTKQGDFVFIPLFDTTTVASCGVGNGLYGVDFSSTDTLPVASSVFNSYDTSRKPFAMYIEGDSMTGADINDGDIVIVNPADEVNSSDTALVCYNDKYFVKWIVYKNNGDIELRSANPAYQPLIIEKEYTEMSSWFRIVGKVVEVMAKKKPKSAY